MSTNFAFLTCNFFVELTWIQSTSTTHNSIADKMSATQKYNFEIFYMLIPCVQACV